MNSWTSLHYDKLIFLFFFCLIIVFPFFFLFAFCYKSWFTPQDQYYMAWHWSYQEYFLHHHSCLPLSTALPHEPGCFFLGNHLPSGMVQNWAHWCLPLPTQAQHDCTPHSPYLWLHKMVACPPGIYILRVHELLPKKGILEKIPRDLEGRPRRDQNHHDRAS